LEDNLREAKTIEIKESNNIYCTLWRLLDKTLIEIKLGNETKKAH